MEIRDDWGPVAKFGPSVATLPTTFTLNSVKSILASSLRRHNYSYKAEWHQLLTHGYYRVREKLL